MEKRTSPRIFKLIKDEILKLRDEVQVLHTFKELRELLWRCLPDEPRFTDETLQTVIGLLDGHHMGLKLTRASGSDGDISVYFGKGVTQEEQVIFAN